MDEHRLDRIESKLDKVVDSVSEINKTLAEQHMSLKHHIKRSDLLEAQMEPIRKHVNMVTGAFKLLGLISLLAGIAVSILKVLS
jgi:uncharacterized coiled-coil protein SlyX